MTEREKMLAGQLYDCGDPELLNRWHLAKNLMRDYNLTDSANMERNEEILSRLLGGKGKNLWIRTILSTVVGEGLDSVIFITISFWGTMENSVVLQMILFQYLFKVLYEALFTPVTYFVVKKIKKAEGIDTFDEGIKYNILRG